jgi:pimeloyl-ACP methyl ester carboxylesterase
LWKKLASDGYLDSSHEDLQRAIPVKVILLAGKKSRPVGRENIEVIASRCKIPISWFDETGHSIHIEETKKFSENVISFQARWS